MKYFRFLRLILVIVIFSTCKKVQPVPSRLVGDWQLAKTYNAAYLSTHYYATGSGYCFEFTNKAYSTGCKDGVHKSFKAFTFSPDASNSDNGQIKFKGKIDPDTYEVSWHGDTLVMTPEQPVYDIKYYIKAN